MKNKQHCWVAEGKYYGGCWYPLCFAPASDLGRRFTRKRALDWAEGKLGPGWRNKNGKLITRRIRIVKYLREK